MWRAQVADPPIKEAADHFCISINQLLLCGYPESRRMHPNWACLPESVRVCEHVYTSNFVKYLSCGKEAWATPMCGWLWGPAGIDAAPFWPIGVQIKFLAYLIRDRAVLPMNDAWPSKHVFCHCHLQEGAWRRARQREGRQDHNMHKQAIQKTKCPYGAPGKTIWTSIGQRRKSRKLEATLAVCDAKMPQEESSALCGDGTDSSAQKQHFLPELVSGAV